MAKRGNSVIGIGLGKHVFKGVLLHRKSDARYVLTSFASREVPEELATAEDLAEQLKLLFPTSAEARKDVPLPFPTRIRCSE